MFNKAGTPVISGQVTALIGDLSGSRKLLSGRRREVQRELDTLLQAMNRDLAPALLARFVLTLGDEFQALLRHPQVLPEILWRLRVGLPRQRMWIGMGRGGLDTPLREEAIGMDGPAFHRARQTLKEAKSSGRYGGLFSGFGDDDPVLNGIAGLLEVHRHGLTDARVAAIQLVRAGASQREAAERLGVTPQAVSKRLKAAHWDAYQEAQRAMALLLSRYETSSDRGDP